MAKPIAGHINNRSKHRSLKFRIVLLAVVNLCVFCAFLVCIELAGYILYVFSGELHVLHKAAHAYYMEHERNVVQYRPECSQYDPGTSYRLKQGGCEFYNREFQINVLGNSIGTRDNEEDITRARVIGLGDSYAFGWGVDQDQAFYTLLENELGEKVLNTGVASYGTVREMRMLDRVFRSDVTDIVIQYTDNDFRENRQYFKQGNKLSIMREVDYNTVVLREVNLSRAYFPGRYTRMFLVPYFQSLLTKKAKLPSLKFRHRQALAKAKAFFNALRNATTSDLSRVRVTIFEINGHNLNSENAFFLRALQKLIRKNAQQPGLANSYLLVDVTSSLRDDDFYWYDEHLKASGHKKVALVLGRAIKEARNSSVIEKVKLIKYDGAILNTAEQGKH
ncbi:MAG: hypothetical protein KDD53_02510 [Bdellovibrionales bacterium]|nr:hypothetical protein [Bdellovibrionales bacterium]